MSERNSQSIKSDRISESSIARIAGNILCGLVGSPGGWLKGEAVLLAVQLAREIAAEVERTKPEAKP